MLTNLREQQESEELVSFILEIGTRKGRKQSNDQTNGDEIESIETQHRITYLENHTTQMVMDMFHMVREVNQMNNTVADLVATWVQERDKKNKLE